MTRTMIQSPTHGKVYFDAVFNTDYSMNAIVTEHPVQVGASITDHAYIAPSEVMLSIGMTDAVRNGSGGRSVTAFAMLTDILRLREPVKLVTRLMSYRAMLVVSISSPDDMTTMHAMKATVMLREIIRTTVTTVKIQQKTSGSTASTSSSPPANKTKPTKQNTTTQQQANNSILNALFG